MINLEVFGKSAAMATVADRLDELVDVSRVRLVDATRARHSVVSAAVRPRAVDTTLEEVRRLGVPDADITLTRAEVVGSLATGPAEASLVWADVIGTAWLNARPIARYLAFMFAAGVIGGYGVIDNNSILIVGAMAVSPDLLPITAIGVGIVARRLGLAGRALLTLAVGLGVAALAAAMATFVQDQLDLLPSDFNIEVTGALGSLTTVSNETIAVALVAGMAGMLALETRASSGVGVAISVTTIPAAAYLGVAAGLLETRRGSRRTRRARHERLDDGRGRSRHARASESAHAPRRREEAERARMTQERRVDVTAAEFRALFQAVSNWGRWGEDDELGTLNELSADRVVAATRLVGSGETVTLSHPWDTEESLDNPHPAEHRMTLLPDVDIGSGTLRFAKDYVGVDYHNDTHTHIDALCHVAFDGAFYNGKPSAALTRTAAGVNTIEAVKNGLVGRGVLLDVPRLRGVPWLEPGEHVFREDLEAAEREQGVTVGRGDILLVRTGHARRLRELGPWDTAKAKAGLHPTTVLYLAERSVAVLGSDGERRHRTEHDRGNRIPDSRAHAERDGSPPDRLPPVRGPRPRL